MNKGIFALKVFHRRRAACRIVSVVTLLSMLTVGSLPVFGLHVGDASKKAGEFGTFVTEVVNGKNVTTIQQLSKGGIIDWTQFNMVEGEKANFNFDKAGSTLFNNVSGTSGKSQIDGIINGSNGGNVWVFNPSGIAFGRTAQVNVGGLFAAAATSFDDIVNKNAIKEAIEAGDVVPLPQLGAMKAQIEVDGGRFEAGQVAFLGKSVTIDGGASFEKVGTLTVGAGNKLGLVLEENVAGGKVSIDMSVFDDDLADVKVSLGDMNAGDDDHAGNVDVVTEGSIAVKGAVVAKGDIDFKTLAKKDASAPVISYKQMSVASGKLLQGKSVSAAAAGRVAVDGDIEAVGDETGVEIESGLYTGINGIVKAVKDVTVTAQGNVNVAGTVESSGGSVLLAAKGAGKSVKIGTSDAPGGSVEATVGSVTIVGAKSAQVQNDSTVTAGGDVALFGGEYVLVDEGATVSATAGKATLTAGTAEAMGEFVGIVGNVTAKNVEITAYTDATLAKTPSVTAYEDKAVGDAAGVFVTGDGASVTATGTLTVKSGGAILADGKLAAKDASLIADAGDVSVANANNDFTGTVTASGGNVLVTDKNNLKLGDVTATGTVTAEAKGGYLSVADGKSVQGNGDVTLTATGNVNVEGNVKSVGGDVKMEATGAGKSVKVGYLGKASEVSGKNVTLKGDKSAQVLAGEVKSVGGTVEMSGKEYVAVNGKVVAEKDAGGNGGNVVLRATSGDGKLTENVNAEHLAGSDAGVLVTGAGSVAADEKLTVDSTGVILAEGKVMANVADLTVKNNGSITLANDGNSIETVNVDGSPSVSVKGDYAFGKVGADADGNVTISGNGADVTIKDEVAATGSFVIEDAEDIALKENVAAKTADLTASKTIVQDSGKTLAAKDGIKLTAGEGVTLKGSVNADSDGENGGDLVVMKNAADKGDLVQDGGEIRANTLTAANIEQTGGTMTAADYIKADGEIKQGGDNATTVMSAKTIEATTVSQTGGKIVASEKIKANVTQSGCEIDTPVIEGSLTQTDASDIATVGKVTGDVIQSAGTITAKGNSLIVAGTTQQSGGTIGDDNDTLTLEGALAQTAGTIKADTLNMNGGASQDAAGTIVAKDAVLGATGADFTLEGTANDFDTVKGAAKNLTVKDVDDLSLGATIATKGNIDATAGGPLTVAGTVSATKDADGTGNVTLTATTGDVDVNAEVKATETAKIEATTGKMRVKGDVTGGSVDLDAGDFINVAAGKTVKATTGDVAADSANGNVDVYGTVKADKGDVRLSATGADKSVRVGSSTKPGVVEATEGNVVLTGGKSVQVQDNSNVAAGTGATLTGGEYVLVDTGAKVMAGGTASLTAGTTTDNGEFVGILGEVSGKTVEIAAHTGAKLSGVPSVSSYSGKTADDAAGVFVTGGKMTATITAAGGSVEATGDARIEATAGNVVVEADGDVSLGGVISATKGVADGSGNVTLTAGTDKTIAVNGSVTAAETATFNSNADVNAGGSVTADTVMLNGALEQSGGKIVADTAYLGGGANQTGGAVEIGSLRFMNAGYDVLLSGTENKIGNVHGTVRNLTLVDSEGRIVIGKSGLPESQNSLVVNGNAKITANGGDITQDGKIVVESGDASFKADGDITLDHGWNLFGGKVNADGGNILIAAGANVANMKLGDVKATGDARAKVLKGNLTVDGGVDADGNVRLESVEGGVIVSGTVNGNNVTLAAANGITENAAVNATADKYVHATGGDINVKANGAVGGDVAYVADGAAAKIVTDNGVSIGPTGGGTTYKKDSTETVVANGSMTSKDGVTTFTDASVVAIDTANRVVVNNADKAVTVGTLGGSGATVTEVLADPAGGTANNGTEAVAIGGGEAVSGIKAKDVSITVTGDPGTTAVSVDKAITATDGNVAISAEKGDVNVNAEVKATETAKIEATSGNVRVKGDVTGENVDIDADGFAQVNGGKKVSATDSATIDAGGSVTVLGTVEGKTVGLTAGKTDASKSVKVQGADAVVSGATSVTMTGGKSVQILAGAKVESEGTVLATADEYIAVNGTVSGKTGMTLETTVEDKLTSAVGGFPEGAPAGVIVQNGAVESTNGAVEITSVGSVMVDGNSTISGKSVSLTANGEGPGQGIQIAGGVTATGGTLDITAKGAGGIQATGTLVADNGATTLKAANGTIDAQNVDNDFKSVTANAKGVTLKDTDEVTLTQIGATAGDATVTAGKQITATDVEASGNATLTATTEGIEVTSVKAGTADGTATLKAEAGSIAKSGAGMVTASDLQAKAKSGIDLNTAVATATADTTDAGNITLNESDAITLTHVKAVGGDVRVRATGNLTVADGTDVRVSGQDIRLEAAEGGIEVGAGVSGNNVTLSANGKVSSKSGEGAFGSISATGEGNDLLVESKGGNIELNAKVSAGDVAAFVAKGNTTGNITAKDVLAKTVYADGHGNVDVKSTANKIVTKTDGNVAVAFTDDADHTIAYNAGGYVKVTANGSLTVDAATAEGADLAVSEVLWPSGRNDARKLIDSGNADTKIEGVTAGTSVKLTSNNGGITAVKDVAAQNGDVTISAAANIDVNSGATVSATGGDATLTAGTSGSADNGRINITGKVEAKSVTTKGGNVTLTANGADVAADPDNNIDAKSAVEITGTVTAEQKAKIAATQAASDNKGSVSVKGNTASVTGVQGVEITSTKGDVKVDKAIVKAGEFTDETTGTVKDGSNANMAITAGKGVTVQDGAKVAASGKVDVDSGADGVTVTGAGTKLAANKEMTIDAEAGAVAVKGGSFVGGNSTVSVGMNKTGDSGTASLTVGDASDATPSQLVAKGNLTANTSGGVVAQNGAKVASDATTKLDGKTVTVQTGAKVLAGENIDIDATGDVKVDGATVAAKGEDVGDAKAVDIQAGTTVTVQGSTVEATAGSVNVKSTGAGNITVQNGGAVKAGDGGVKIENAEGGVTVENGAAISAAKAEGSEVAANVDIDANGNVVVQKGSVTGAAAASVTADGNVTIDTTGGNVTVDASKVEAGGDVVVGTATGTRIGGTFTAQNGATVTAGANAKVYTTGDVKVDGSGTSVMSKAGDAEIDAKGNIDVTGATVSATGGDAKLTAGTSGSADNGRINITGAVEAKSVTTGEGESQTTKGGNVTLTAKGADVPAADPDPAKSAVEITGTVTAAQKATIKATQATGTNKGSVEVKGATASVTGVNVDIDAAGAVMVDNATVAANGADTATTKAVDIQAGTTITVQGGTVAAKNADGSVAVKAGTGVTIEKGTQDATVKAGKDVTINTTSGNVTVGKDGSSEADKADASLITAGGNVSLTADNATGQGVTIRDTTSVNATAGTVAVTAKGGISVNDTATVEAGTSVMVVRSTDTTGTASAVTIDTTGAKGVTANNGNVTIENANGNVLIDKATVTATEKVVVGKKPEGTASVADVKGDVTVRGGANVTGEKGVEVYATGDVTVNNATVKAGVISDTGVVGNNSNAPLTIDAGKAVIIEGGAKVGASGTATVTAKGVDNDTDKNGVVVTGSGTKLVADKGLTVKATATDDADAEVLNNVIISGGAYVAGRNANQGNKVEISSAKGSVTVTGKDGSNVATAVEAGKDLAVTAYKDVTVKESAKVGSNQKVEITATTGDVKVENKATVIAKTGVTVTAPGVTDAGTGNTTGGNVTVSDATVRTTGGDINVGASGAPIGGTFTAQSGAAVTADAGSVNVYARGDAKVLDTSKVEAKGGDAVLNAQKKALVDGQVIASANATLTAKEGVEVSKGTDDVQGLVAANGGKATLTTETGDVVVKDGAQVTATGDADLKATKSGVTVQNNAKVLAGTLKANGAVDMSGSVTIEAGQGEGAAAGAIAISGSAEVRGTKDVTVTAKDSVKATGSSSVSATSGAVVLTAQGNDGAETDAVAVQIGGMATVEAGTSVTIKSTGAGDVTIDTTGKDTGEVNKGITANAGNVTIDNDNGAVTVKNAKVEAKGANGSVDIDATGDVKIEKGAQNATVKAGKDVLVESTAGNITVKDSTVTAGEDLRLGAAVDNNDEAVTGTVTVDTGVSMTAAKNATIEAKGDVTLNSSLTAKGEDAWVGSSKGDVSMSAGTRIEAGGNAYVGADAGSAKLTTIKAGDAVSVKTKESITSVNTDDSLNIEADKVRLETTQGDVGAADGKIEMSVSNIQISAPTGSAYFHNSGKELTIGGAKDSDFDTKKVLAGGGVDVVKAGNVSGITVGGDVALESDKGISISEGVKGRNVTVTSDGDLKQSVGDTTVNVNNGKAEVKEMQAAITAESITLNAGGSIGSVGTGKNPTSTYVAVKGNVTATAGRDVAVAAAEGDLNVDGISAGGNVALYTTKTLGGNAVGRNPAGAVSGENVTVTAHDFKKGLLGVVVNGRELTSNNLREGAMRPLIAIYKTKGGKGEPDITKLPNDAIVFVDGRLAGGDIKIINTLGAVEAFPVQTPELKSEQGVFGNPAFLHDELDVANPLAVGAIDFILIDVPSLALSGDFPVDVDEHVLANGLSPTTSYWFGQGTDGEKESEQKKQDVLNESKADTVVKPASEVKPGADQKSGAIGKPAVK